MSKVIVALDGMTLEDSLKLAEKLSGHVWGYKVNDLLLWEGCRVVTKLHAWGNVMCDPKLYDIPNTVSNAVKRMVDAGAGMITVHASAGTEVLQAAHKAAQGHAKILAITVLTSDKMDFRDHEVRKRAYIAQHAGVDGIVCAAPDLEKLKDVTLLKVVPGIRPPTAVVKGDDQVHTASSIPGGADFVVVGRPITQAENPLEVAKSLQKN